MALAAFTVVAQSGERYSSFAPYVPSISDGGVVAFQAALASGGTAIVLWSDGDLTEVARSGGQVGEFISHPDLNAVGEMCVYASMNSGEQAVLSLRRGGVSALAKTGEMFAAIGPLGPTMNETGSVAFRGDLQSGESGIFVAHGSAVTEIARTGRRFSAFHGLPVIDRHGSVLFRADLSSGGSGLFLGTGAGVTTLADTSGEFEDFGRFPALDHAGMAACCASDRDGISGLFTFKEGRVERLLDSTGKFESFRGILTSKARTPIFYAVPRGGQLGIFTGPEPVADKLLGLGETLMGSEVTEFALNPVSINGAGVCAIRVRLLDEREMIVITT